jgi:CotH kinase protein/Right handed beta helix region
MTSHSKYYPYWPIFIAVLLLIIMSNIIFGGISGMMQYKKVMVPNLHFTTDNLRHFSREYILRQYQKLAAKPLPSQTTLPSFFLFADERDLESLESDLPASAKLQFKKGHIRADKPIFSDEVEFRYRGGLDLHWMYEKKSLRIKLPPFSTYRNERQFNLVNPSTVHTITDWVSYDMARSIGLLTPDYFPARVFINNETNGLHFFLSKLDESFLRKNKRMPGSIYSGDTLYLPHLFGKNSGLGEALFHNNGTPELWYDHRLWKKDAARNMESSAYDGDIKLFIKSVNESNPIEFMKLFDTHFDKNKFYLFWALDELVGSYHHDLFHNHRIYFDPYKGKFEPIEWDIRFWSSFNILAVTPFFKQVLLNPVLKYEYDSVMYELRNKFTVESVIDMINHADNSIKDELAADPYRQQPELLFKIHGYDNVIPFSMDEYSDAIETLKKIYKYRYDYLEDKLSTSIAEYNVEELSENQVQVSIALSGNSAINFDPWSIVPESLHRKVELFRVYEDNVYPILKNEQSDKLYPGIKIIDGFNRTNIGADNVKKMVLESYAESPLYYRYLIKGVRAEGIINEDKLIGKNAITSDEITIKKVDGLPDNSDTASFHPWQLLSLADKNVEKEITLSGEVIVEQDLIFTDEQTVTILPGTLFKLAKDTSIYFYGKVTAKGTEESPIKFEQKESGQVWGSIVIQGKKATDSYISHIHVNGGSVTSRNLIDYPGQFNIHELDSFHLSHCVIGNNSIGDDSLHVAYSHGEIQHCEFKDSPFDALDMDIVDVTVSNSRFSNIGNDAIDLMNSSSVINNVDINGTGDKCISVGEASDVKIMQSQLTDCVLGIAVKDQSIVHIEDIEFSVEKKKAIALYRKNARYSRGGEISGDRLYGITEQDIDVGEYSVNKIQHSAYYPLTKVNTNHESKR